MTDMESLGQENAMLREKVIALEHQLQACSQWFRQAGDKNGMYHIVMIHEIRTDGFGPFVQSLWVSKALMQDNHIDLSDAFGRKLTARFVSEWFNRYIQEKK